MAILFSTYATYKRSFWIVFTKAFKVILTFFYIPIQLTVLSYICQTLFTYNLIFFILDLASIIKLWFINRNSSGHLGASKPSN